MIVEKLISLANKFDKEGLGKEADRLDGIVEHIYGFYKGADLTGEEKATARELSIREINRIVPLINQSAPLSKDRQNPKRYWRTRLGHYGGNRWFTDGSEDDPPVLIFGFSQRGIESLKDKADRDCDEEDRDDCPKYDTTELKRRHVMKKVDEVLGSGFIRDGRAEYVDYSDIKDTAPPDRIGDFARMFVVKIIPRRT